MNLISGAHHSRERREYTFMVFQEYTIISHGPRVLSESICLSAHCTFVAIKGLINSAFIASHILDSTPFKTGSNSVGLAIENKDE